VNTSLIYHTERRLCRTMSTLHTVPLPTQAESSCPSGQISLYPRYATTRVLAIGLCLCLSVCHTSVLYRNGCKDRAGFLLTGLKFPRLVLNCVLGKLGYLRKQGYFPLSFVPNSGLGNLVTACSPLRERDIKTRHSSGCCFQHLATTADVASAVNSRRRLPTVDHTRRPAAYSAMVDWA